MPSHLRLQLDLESTQSYYPRNTSPIAQQKSKMSLTQTYRVASTARGKLGMEASRPDHNLRVLVGHANLLDSLMVELSDAEREQEAWFNDTIRNSRHADAPRHVQWIDTVAEEQDSQLYDEDDSSSDSDSDSEIDEDEYTYTSARRRSVSPPPPVVVSSYEIDEDYEDEDVYEDEDSDSDELALERVPSRTPELIHEDSSDSEDESLPPSPINVTIPFDPKTQTVLDGSSLFSLEKIVELNQSPLISAY